MDFTPIAVYYFLTRCEEHLDIDSFFQPTMDKRLKGNSLTVGTMIQKLHQIQMDHS